MSVVVFYFLAFCIGASAVLSVTVRDVFHSAIWLTLTLLSIACLYFYLDAGFLGVIQILVYVGGIMTLFVFAIMLTARIGDRSIQQTNRQLWPGLLISAGAFTIMLKIILSGPWANLITLNPGIDLKVVGRALLTQYVLPFEFISIILLAALVGAIVIGKVKE